MKTDDSATKKISWPFFFLSSIFAAVFLGVFIVVESAAAPGAFPEVTSTHIPAGHPYVYSVVSGDLDGDCDIDLIGWYMNSTDPRIFRNDGTGRFTTAPDTAFKTIAGISKYRTIELGDVDGDGDLDAFILTTRLGGSTPQLDHLFLNDGKGNFTDVSSTNLPAILTVGADAILFDADGDGDLDLYLCIGAFVPTVSGQDRLYLNNGSGVFADATAARIPTLSDVSFAVDAGDVDGDGDPDLIVTRRGSANKILINNGAGTFTDQSATRLPSAATNSHGPVLLMDIDRDGDLDFYEECTAVPSPFVEQDRLYLNNGSGVFTETTTWLPAFANSATMPNRPVADFDGDGYPEFYVQNSGGRGAIWTGGATSVTDITATVASGHMGDTLGTAAIFFDMDLDGDKDILIARGPNGSMRLFRNPAGSNSPPSRPRSVSELKATYLGSGQVRLTWKPSPDSTGIRYRVYTDSGTGSINYDTAVTSFLKAAGETTATVTLPGMRTDTFVLFAVRVSDGCGRAETQAPVVGVATVAAGSSPFASCIEIKAPHAGRKVDGNRLNVIADVCGSLPDRRQAVASIRFDFRAAGPGAWTAISPADAAFPNPDAKHPWFVHWDVTALAAGAYEIRAVGTDTAGQADPYPPVVQVFVDHTSWEVRDTVVGGRARHEASVPPEVATEVSQAGRGGSGASGRSGTTRIEIPAGLRSQTDTIQVEVLDAESTVLASGFPGGGSGVGEYREISWASGTTNFGDSTVDISLSYADVDGDGIVDSTAIPAASLAMYYRSGSSWLPVTTLSVDTANREVRGRSNHFTVFGLGGGSSSGLGLGGAGCLMTRASLPGSVLDLLRAVRDGLLGTSVGRLLTALYYAAGGAA